MIVSLKALGRKDQWARYWSGGAYKDSTQIGPYKVEIDENSDDIRFFLWDPKRPCVVMVIDKHDTTAVLDSIRYDLDCTSPEQMKRRTGTKEMIDFCLQLLKKYGATKVYLTDKSTIDCNGIDIQLGPMYFLKYGETWYEKYFGFKPSAKFAESYKLAKKERAELLNTELVKIQQCDFFSQKVIDDLFRHIGFVNFYSIAWEKDLTSSSS